MILNYFFKSIYFKKVEKKTKEYPIFNTKLKNYNFKNIKRNSNDINDSNNLLI